MGDIANRIMKIKNSIESAKEAKLQMQGKKEVLLEDLCKTFDLHTIEEAKERLLVLEKELYETQDELNMLVDTYEKNYMGAGNENRD